MVVFTRANLLSPFGVLLLAIDHSVLPYTVIGADCIGYLLGTYASAPFTYSTALVNAPTLSNDSIMLNVQRSRSLFPYCHHPQLQRFTRNSGNTYDILHLHQIKHSVSASMVATTTQHLHRAFYSASRYTV
ncbi:hypothetical protein F5Y04DRAFT_185371 [Hypomontagnella monticulosa]|nr:hypothetical protein F5Y04DRAFT_185371 [Hypomontagnella monticulosa]